MRSSLPVLLRLLAGLFFVSSSVLAQPDWSDNALRVAHDSLMSLAENLPDDSLRRKSSLLHQAGNVADEDGRIPLAIEHTLRALNLRMRDEAELSDGVLVSAMNLGIYYAQLEQYTDALHYFGLVTDRRPNRKEAFAWYHAGRAYGAIGQYAEGEQAFNRAAQLPDFADSPYLTAYLQEQAAALSLGKNNAAGGAAAIPLLTAALNYFLADEDDIGEMETRNYLGWAYAETGNYDSAIRELEKASELATKLKEYETLASVHSNLGLAFRRKGDAEGAIAEYERAYEVQTQHDDNLTLTAAFLDNLSTAKLEAGQPVEAVKYAQEALEAALPAYKRAEEGALPTLSEINRDLPDVLVYLTDLARAQRAVATMKPTPPLSAMKTYRLADEVLDVMRKRQLLEDTRTYWRADARSLYDEAISTALEAEDANSVFYFMEKARARLLLDEISAARAEELLPEPLRKRLSAASRNVRLSPENPQALRQFSSLQDSILHAFPEYARQRNGAEPPSLSDIPGVAKHGYLLEYYLAGETTVALVIEPGGSAKTHRLAAPSVWEPLLWEYRKQLSDPATRPPAETAKALYDYLLAPLELPLGADLIIIPDGELYLLPFGALLKSIPDADQSMGNWPWLVKTHGINYAHSVQLLALAEGERGKGNGRALALAPVAQMPATKSGLELPATLRTVRHLAGLLPTDTLINESATRAAFRNQADEYSLLHLGTHAYPSGGGSFLLRDEPGHYTGEDLLNHRLKADLVVIGACETGMGEHLVGEGIASLGRNFTRRGASGVIMSLWSIDDGATAELLNHTYTGLADGLGPATALREAGTSYREDLTNPRFAHPYYWAGLIHYGPDKPLTMLAKSRSWLIYGLLALMLIVATGFVFKKIRPADG